MRRPVRRPNSSFDPMSLRTMLNEDNEDSDNSDEAATDSEEVPTSAERITQQRQRQRQPGSSEQASNRHQTVRRQRRQSPTRQHGRQLSDPVNRPSRPPYTLEQQICIWYLRTDLSMAWREVETRFDAYFPGTRGRTGLQCRFYRTLEEWGVASIRNRDRSRDSSEDGTVGAYGVIQRTSLRYWWMRRIDRDTPCLPQFYPGHLPPRGTRSP